MSLKVFKIIFFLIIYLHCVGCCWFWIVSISQSWLPSSHEFDGGNFYQKSIFSQYLTSMYHSVLLFTGNDVNSQNLYEFLYCIPILIAGALINANIFGEVAVIVTSSNRQTMKFQERIDITRNSMRNLNLPESLQ